MGSSAGRWQGQVVIVTGASSGIGAALSRAYSERGACVALAARRAERLAETAAACPGETLSVVCDVTDGEGRRRLVAETLDRWGRIDVLVNNAGCGMYAPFDEIEEEDFRALLDVNLIAVLRMTQEVLPILRAAGRGGIVNIASTGGLIAHAPHLSAYLAAKHAVVGLSRGLRRDLEETGIFVQAVCPHLTDTDFFSTGVGAEVMHTVADRLRDRMDTAREVAEGTVEQTGSGPFLVFPTERSRRAYERFREGEE